MIRKWKRMAWTSGAVLIASLIGCTATWAAQLKVCSDGCRFTTIQSAVDHAKSGDTVSIDQGVYFESVLITNDAVTLQGAGSTRTIIHGSPENPVIKMTCATSKTHVQLADLMITGALWVPGSDEGPPRPRGGGVYSDGCSLSVTRAQIVDNAAEGMGGGINSTGPLTMVDSLVANNTADAAGGMLLTAPAHIVRTLVQQNRGTGYHTNAGGGGIVSNSDLTIDDSTIIENRSPDGCCGPGGGIRSIGNLTMSNTRVAGNLGNGIFMRGRALITNCTITDNSIIALSGSAGGITNSGVLIIKQSLVANNSGDGGGILNTGTLQVSHSVFTRNSSAYGGGGILNYSVLEVDDVSIVANIANDGGGGIYDAPGATTTIEHSTISGNIPDNCAGSGISCP